MKLIKTYFILIISSLLYIPNAYAAAAAPIDDVVPAGVVAHSLRTLVNPALLDGDTLDLTRLTEDLVVEAPTHLGGHLTPGGSNLKIDVSIKGGRFLFTVQAGHNIYVGPVTIQRGWLDMYFMAAAENTNGTIVSGGVKLLASSKETDTGKICGYYGVDAARPGFGDKQLCWIKTDEEYAAALAKGLGDGDLAFDTTNIPAA